MDRTSRRERASASLESSLVLGRYRVLWPLESKKLIKSYIARDEHRDGLGTLVLIKQYLHDLGDKDSPLAAAMWSELRRLLHVRHPGVVSLLDYGSLQRGVVTAHSHLPGVALKHLCDLFARKQEQFPPHFAIYIARRLLDTLQHCHTRPGNGFVHGRLTLGCIQLPTTTEPQIADFGLAALEDVAAEAEMQLGFFQTRMSYSAPEMTRGAHASPQGDTYSTALLLYRLLAGSNPFRGRSVPETLQRVLQLAPAHLSMPGWEGCDRINAVLTRALDKDPKVRFQSCHELSQALRSVQIQSDEGVREELAGVIRQNSAEDLAMVARIRRSARRSTPAGKMLRDQLSRSDTPPASRAPAFVSGLISARALEVGEHAWGVRREVPQKRRRDRSLLMIPTVLIPAVAIILGLFLGRLGGAGWSAAVPQASTSRASPSLPLVNAMVEDLRGRFRRCASDRPEAVAAADVELEFGPTGALAGVHLDPHELSHSRLGACLLAIAWDANLRVSGSMSVKIPLRF